MTQPLAGPTDSPDGLDAAVFDALDSVGPLYDRYLTLSGLATLTGQTQDWAAGTSTNSVGFLIRP